MSNIKPVLEWSDTVLSNLTYCLNENYVNVARLRGVGDNNPIKSMYSKRPTSFYTKIIIILKIFTSKK